MLNKYCYSLYIDISIVCKSINDISGYNTNKKKSCEIIFKIKTFQTRKYDNYKIHYIKEK